MPVKPCFHAALDGLYVLHKTLGSGGFAKVKLATHVLTGEKVAVKIMCKEALGDDLERIRLEIEALKVLNHQNVCKLYQIIETDVMIYLILEYCPGGELFDYIIQKERLEESEARMFFRQIVSAVGYVHKKGYAHRDLKPENLLLHGDHTIKLIDFGLCAKPKSMKEQMKTCCGSPAYAAPELLSGTEYNGSMVDVWSLGVLLYALLCGFLPFDDENVTKLYRKIQKGKYSCPSWLSTESKLILADMLQVDPERRISVDFLMLHPWIIKGVYSTVRSDSIYENEPLDGDCLSELAAYHRKSKRAIEIEIRKNKFDYSMATYLLLLKKKKDGKPLCLLHPPTTVLKETKQCNRSLASQFSSKPIETRLSFDDLDDIDLLNLGSPVKSFASVRSPVYASQKSCVESDKENFLVPVVSSPKKSTKKNKGGNDVKGALSGLSNSLDFEVTKVPVAPFLSNPLDSDKRAKSLDSPLSTQHLTATPPRRRVWESSSLSAKKVLGSIEKSLDKVRNMITPNKRLYSCGVSTPRKVKTLCNVSATSEKVTPDELLDSLQLALLQKGIPCKQQGYSLMGKIRDNVGKVLLKFELEVCRLPRHHVVGVRRKRLVGDAWHYKRVCEEVLKLALLVPKPAP